MNETLDPRRHAYRKDLADVSLQGRVEARHFVEGEAYQVTEASAPLHAEPRSDSYMVTEALYGERIQVYEAREGWVWGQLERDSYVGYLPQSVLEIAGAPSTHRVSALRTYIFPGPDIKLPPLALISMEAEVAVVKTQGQFAVLSDGSYLVAQHLSLLDEYADDFVQVAVQFLGAPYRWGGKQSIGLDCSGLVQVALHRAGITCPRDSDMQEAELGEALGDSQDLAQLQRGDLIFWQGHVGIMLDKTNLLHANGHHMATAIEPVAGAVARIAANHGPVTSLKRLK